MRARARRLLLLFVVLGVVGGGVVAYLAAQRRLDEEARAARVAGLDAFARGEYGPAMLNLGKFLRRLEPDAETLLRYAQAIRRMPGADARHLDSAVGSLRRCLRLKEDDREARGELLDLYMQMGVRAEALEQAEWFLARDPNDARALRAKASTLTDMRRFDEALALLQEHVPPEAPRLEEHLLHLAVLAGLERPAQELLAQAARVEKAQAADPRFRLVDARARLLTGDLDGARATLQALAPVAPGDAPFARLLLAHLDRAGLPREALRVLRGFAPQDLSSELQADLVRRLWEVGEGSAAVAQVEAWGPDRAGLPVTVLGYEALALVQLKRLDDAQRNLALIEGRGGDLAATGWAVILRDAVLAPSPSVAARLGACLRAVEADAGNAVSHYQLACAYRDAGEVELAARSLHTASTLARSWAEPPAAGARLLAESGRLPAALRAATEARARLSDDPGVRMLLGLAEGASGVGPTAGGPGRLLTSLQGLGVSAQDLLPIRIAVLTAAGSFEEVRALLSLSVEPGERPEGSVLLAGALISRAKGFALEDRCFARYEELHGRTPALALARARMKMEQGEGDAAWAEFRASAVQGGAAPGSGRPGEWAAAEASLLEALGKRTEALASWRDAIRQGAGDPALLRAALEATATWSDRNVARSAIDALKAATHPSCLGWRYYEARWLLTAPEGEAQAQESAEKHLREILLQAPEQARARLLLARIHEIRGEPNRAVEQLRVARGLLGSSVAVDLQIARLQIQAADWVGARETLERLVAPGARGPTNRLGARERLAMAAMFARLGERSSVLAMLDRGADEAEESEEMEGRAELFAAAGELGSAESLVRSVLAAKESPRSLLLGAAIAEFSGRSEEAEALLTRLDARTADTAQRERQRAEHYMRVSRLEAAEVHLRRLVDLPAARAGDWSNLLTCQVARGLGDAAVATLELAASRGVALTKEKEPAIVGEVLRIAAARPELRSLGVAHVQETVNRASAEQAVRALGAPRAAGLGAADRGRLRSLAQQNPRFLALQLAVAEHLAQRGELDDAREIFQTASVAFPMAPEPVRSLAFCLRAMGQTERAAEAAKRWRERVSGIPVEPDFFLAQQSPAEQAATLLEPHVQVAIARGMQDVLRLYGESMILSGDVGRLRQVFEPGLVSGDRTVVATWCALAGFLAARGEGAAAAEWLQRDAVQKAASRDPSVRVELAGAWAVLAQADQSQTARDAAAALLRDLGDTQSLGAREWQILGQMHEGLGDRPAAEKAYRQALAKPERPLVALNNLAMLLASTGRAKEAIPLATELVGYRPDQVEYQDTLASVLAAAGDVPGAVSHLEQNRKLEPANARWAIRILEVLLAQGDRQAAEQKMREFRRLYPESKMSLEQRAAWEKVASSLGGAGG